jgi:hypothetical protein
MVERERNTVVVDGGGGEKRGGKGKRNKDSGQGLVFLFTFFFTSVTQLWWDFLWCYSCFFFL